MAACRPSCSCPRRLAPDADAGRQQRARTARRGHRKLDRLETLAVDDRDGVHPRADGQPVELRPAQCRRHRAPHIPRTMQFDRDARHGVRHRLTDDSNGHGAGGQIA